MPIAMLLGLLLSPTTPACAQTHCHGKRAKHFLDVFQFCVPVGIDYHRVAGFEGDLHDRITVQMNGEVSELIIFTANVTWGPLSDEPNWPHHWGSAVDWSCPEGNGRDFRLETDDRHWRYLTFPKGYAEYKNVPSKAAAKFDKILDSLCCRPIRSRSNPR